jgi:hypothetical protein
MRRIFFAFPAYPLARRVGLNGKKSNLLSGRLIFQSTLKLQERLPVRRTECNLAVVSHEAGLGFITFRLPTWPCQNGQAESDEEKIQKILSIVPAPWNAKPIPLGSKNPN